MLCMTGIVFPSSSSLLSPTETPSGNSSPSLQTSTASLVPVIASGTIVCTSCAKKPSTVVSASAIKLKREGLSCFNLVVASQSVTTFSFSL
jgi:hypothetical protein